VENPGRSRREPTHYLNEDLDIVSRAPLQDLVDAMGPEAFVLYVGGKGQRYEAHLEWASSHMGITPDRTIIGLTRLVTRLPPRYRTIWDSARSRAFNVGIEAGLEPHSYELRLGRRTLNAVAEVGGALIVTVYAPVVNDGRASRVPDRPAAKKRSRSRTGPSR
jgi:hypothetical protein